MSQSTPIERIPVTVLTGFLGAGKTSLLNRLLANPRFADTAVIVNEFGAVGVDGDLVEQADGRAFAMTTGRLCCTVAGDILVVIARGPRRETVRATFARHLPDLNEWHGQGLAHARG